MNTYAKDAKNMPVKRLPDLQYKLVEGLPNFHKTGSIKGMKKKFYGQGALLVRCGNYIYNVTSKPEIYDKAEKL